MSRRAAAAAYFFFLLSAWAMLRPVRDEIASRNPGRLPWLFTGTLAAALLVAPAAGAVAARLSRRRFLAALALFLSASAAAFAGAIGARSGAPWRGPAFFLWVNAFVLFSVSISWSAMTELFALPGEAEESFGLAAAGGSAGTLAGPALSAAAARLAGPGAALLGASALFALAAVAARSLFRGAPDVPVGTTARGALAGAFRSRFLRRVSLATACYTAISTFAYFFQTEVVARAVRPGGARAALFAEIDLAVNALAILLQLVAVGPLLRRFGPARTLSISSAVVALALGGVAAAPGLATVVALQLAHRAGHFAVGRPAREALFVPLDPESRFQAKNFIDTAVFRGSDAASAWLVAGLRAGGLGIAGAAAAAIPIAILWTATNRALAPERR